MGCNCNKKKQTTQTPQPTQEPIKVPQTPEEQLNQELRIWGGGVDIKIELDGKTS